MRTCPQRPTFHSSTFHSPFLLSGCVLLLLATTAAAGERVSERPNIVVILADDMGYGDVRALNTASTIPTPSLDRMAADGLTFLDAHSPSAVCTPTRYALLTGRYCWRSRLKKGVLGGYSEPLLEPRRSTVASVLHAAGYKTGAVGKWHLGMQLPKTKDSVNTKAWDGDPGIDFAGVITDSPIHHGFDSYFGVSASLDMAPYVYIRDDHFVKQPTLQQKAIKFPRFVRKGPRSDDFEIDGVLDRLTEEASNFITAAAKSDQPYFLYVPLTGPHKPAWPHPRFEGSTSLKAYGDFVHQVDWTVGEIIKSIDATGEGDNTLVIFTSDNGSYMYRYDEADAKDHIDDVTIQGFRPEHHTANGVLRGTKADIWEAGHRVPFFVRWPAVITAGGKQSTTICHTDIFATCVAVGAGQTPAGQAEDSHSFLAALQGQAFERGAPVINHSAAGMFALRDGRWKLVFGNGSGGRQQPRGKPFEKPFQLFDLEADLAETTNVAPDHPEIVERMTQMLEEVRGDD